MCNPGESTESEAPHGAEPPASTPSQGAQKTPPLICRLSPAKPTVVFDTFWRLAVERQSIFFRRFHGQPEPWTEDPILCKHKFTNAYRASDRVSQYLIRRVIYEGESSPQEVFFRVILFKTFNKIETWEMLRRDLGEITYSDYSFERYDSILSHALAVGKSIYSGAYIMPSGGHAFGFSRKHRNHLRLIERMMEDEVPLRLEGAKAMQQVFDTLLSYPMIGPFLAYQYATDINYSEITDFSEMGFVVPGPGALDGIRKCFTDLGGLNEPELIRLVTEQQDEHFRRLGLDFQSLWGRPLQLIDCQNLFCEVDKYSRIAHPEFRGRTGRSRIKQVFRPTRSPIQLWYPPKWGLNERIQKRQGESNNVPD
jgi:hypothetical protein